MLPSARFLFLLSLLACLLASAAQVNPYCRALTGIPNCVECLGKKCFYCSYRTSPIWTGTTASPSLTECRIITIGNPSCKDIDAQCAACERINVNPAFAANKCVRCNPYYGLVNGKCLKVVRTTASESTTTIQSNCQQASMNANCIECNPDATCRRCRGSLPFLSPTNTIWLDAGYPETQCTTKATIGGFAKSIAGIDLMATNAIATQCAELDTDFRCAACNVATSAEPRGFGPKPTADPNKIDCVPNSGTVVKDAVTGKPFVSVATNPVGQNGCYMKLPYMQYCLKCSDDGRKCLATFNGRKYGCTGWRSIDPSGLCSLNCKGLFGIACKACSAQSCLELDSAYSGGR